MRQLLGEGLPSNTGRGVELEADSQYKWESEPRTGTIPGERLSVLGLPCSVACDAVISTASGRLILPAPQATVKFKAGWHVRARETRVDLVRPELDLYVDGVVTAP